MQYWQESGLYETHKALIASGASTPSQIAAKVGLDLSTVSRHLKDLVLDGRATRTRQGRSVLYAPTRLFEVRFAGPLGKQTPATRPWAHLEWSTDQPIDWRFPLISRIPDGPSQQTLKKLLEACHRQGIFQPWLTFPADAKDRWLRDQPANKRERLTEQLKDARFWGGYEFIVFGSCARGDTREESDLDLLIIGPTRNSWEQSLEPSVLSPPPYDYWHQRLRQLIDELNIGTARHLEVLLEPDLPLAKLPTSLRDTIVKEGITVYTSTGTSLSLEEWRSPDG